eukprot:6191729-Pleurochrysis_carterae.AAC.5
MEFLSKILDGLKDMNGGMEMLWQFANFDFEEWFKNSVSTSFKNYGYTFCSSSVAVASHLSSAIVLSFIIEHTQKAPTRTYKKLLCLQEGALLALLLGLDVHRPRGFRQPCA